MARVTDLGKYYSISADTRDLNYEKYFTKGIKKISILEDYNSHNVELLDKEKIKKILLKLDFIKEALR